MNVLRRKYDKWGDTGQAIVSLETYISSVYLPSLFQTLGRLGTLLLKLG